MEFKNIPVLDTRNIGFNFFGSLVVSQDAVMEFNRCPIADIKVYEGLMNAGICHGFNDVVVIDLKELVRLYVYMRANKNKVIQVLGYLIDRGVVYERPGAGPIRYSNLWSRSPIGVYIATALYDWYTVYYTYIQDRHKTSGPEVENVKGESEEGTEEKN
jgi:hypothetical protein